MKRRQNGSFLRVEALEQRENPAGTITTSLTGGVLSIIGGDESSNITVDFNGPIVFTANNGETFTNNNLNGAVNSIVIKMGGGNDTITVPAGNQINVGGGTGSISVDMGNGTNFLDFGNLQSINSGKFTYRGGESNDELDIQTTAASAITGGVSVTGTYGNLTVGLGTTLANGMNVTGGIKVTNNFGETDVTLDRVNTSTLAVNGGDSPVITNVNLVEINNSKFTGPISLSMGLGVANVNVDGGIIKGANVTSKVDANFTATSINFDSAATSTGNVTVKAANAAVIDINQTGVTDSIIGNLSATGASSSVTVIGGTIGGSNSKTVGNVTTKSSNTGDTLINVNSATSVGNVSASTVGTGDDAQIFLQSIGRTGAITVASNDNAEVSLLSTTTGVSATKTGGNIRATGSSATLRSTSGANTVNGTVTLTGSKNASTINVLNVATTLTVEGVTTLAGFNSAQLALNAGSGAVDFKNNVSMKGNNPLGISFIQAQGTSVTFQKNLTSTSAGRTITTFATSSLSEVKGDLTVTGGAFEDILNFNANVKAKNVRVNFKNGNASVIMGALGSTPIAISGALSIASGGGFDNIALNGVNVGGSLKIETGINADVVTINNSTFALTSAITTGTGDDSLSIANSTGSTQATTFTGLANFNMGDGNDTVTLGLLTGGDANSLATFTALTSKIDGSLALDVFSANGNTNLPGTQMVGF